MKKIKFECPICCHTELELIREGRNTTETVIGWDEDEMKPILAPPELCEAGDVIARCWCCGRIICSNAGDNEELYEKLKKYLVEDENGNAD